MKKTQYVLLFVCTMLFMVGCNNNSASPNNAKNQQVEVEQSSFQSDNIMNNNEIAAHLATVASQVTDVHDAAAVVAGPYAVVAIDIDENVERQETGKIKYTVIEAMEHDPYGRGAVVVADADMFTRIKEMKNSIQNGAPVEGVADELGNIVSRYMPTFPIDDGPSTDENPNGEFNDNLVEQEQEQQQ